MDICNKCFRAKKGFVHRKVAESDVLISVGGGVADFNGYVLLNPTASFLWDLLNEPRTVNDLSLAVAEEFEVSTKEATEDVKDFIQMLIDREMVEETDSL